MKFSSKQRSSHQNHFHKRKNHQRYNNCINSTHPVVPTSTTGIVGSCECIVAPVATLLGCSLPRQAQPTQTKFRVWGPHSRDCSVMKNVVKVDQNCQPKLVPSCQNGPHVHAAFMNIIEAAAFYNRQHQQGVVSEREQ